MNSTGQTIERPDQTGDGRPAASGDDVDDVAVGGVAADGQLEELECKAKHWRKENEKKETRPKL